MPKNFHYIDSKNKTKNPSNTPINVIFKTIVDYANHTTIHGVAYIFDKSSLILENILWLLVFGTFASLAISFSMEAYNQWQDNPVLTSVKTTGKLHKN